MIINSRVKMFSIVKTNVRERNAQSNCPKKECNKYKFYKIPLCKFCKVGFINCVIEGTDKSRQLQLYIDGVNVSDDSDEGDIDYINLSFK